MDFLKLQNTTIIRASSMLLLLFCVSCSEEVITPQEYPRINTLEVLQINENGALLEAEILSKGEEKIIDHGFLLSHKPDVDTNDCEIRRLGPYNGIGNYSFFLNTNLVPEESYYSIAFVRTSSQIIFGQSRMFRSRGSEGIKAINILDREVITGDTIKITGKGFSTTLTGNIAFIGEWQANIINETDTCCYVILPDSVYAGDADLHFETAGKKCFFEDAIHILNPVIESFYPQVGNVHDTIQLRGENFGWNRANATVFIGDSEAEIVDYSNKNIRIVLPNIKGNREAFRLNINNLQASISGFKSLEYNVLDFFPKTGTFLDTITITGEHLPINEPPIVQFGSNYIGWAKVIDHTSESIRVLVPTTIEQTELDVTVKIDHVDYLLSQSFQLKAMRIDSISPSYAQVTKPVTVYGYGFNPEAYRNIASIRKETYEEHYSAYYATSKKFMFKTRNNTSTGETDLYITNGAESIKIEKAITFFSK